MFFVLRFLQWLCSRSWTNLYYPSCFFERLVTHSISLSLTNGLDLQVIQAVTTYKSLVGFVSTTLLSRLITKKIWTNPPLWEGFIRCAKVIAPASFGALLQLPKDQLRELVDKQPSLKSGLRDYVTKKATNKARVTGFLDIFGEPGDNGNVTPVVTPSPIPEMDLPPSHAATPAPA